METNLLRKQAVQTPARHVITPADVIGILSGICESRNHAYSFYPYSISREKWEAIHYIRFQLEQAKFTLNWKMQLRMILKTELAFHTIADRNPRRMEKYLKKLNDLMQACREALGWVEQR